ncbi:MAG: hypothetical protein ACI89X_002479 [Planctomycetota bacterium]|jgi:hypothetical protein
MEAAVASALKYVWRALQIPPAKSEDVEIKCVLGPLLK